MEGIKVCTLCEEPLPNSSFGKIRKGSSKVRARCKECCRRLLTAWKNSNPHSIRRYYEKYKGRRKERRRQNFAKERAYQKAFRERTRNKVFDHYGRECCCCGETERKFLSIDHENGGGRRHLREINGSLYLWLVVNNFPSGFQTMCHNCNHGRYLNGGVCPHKEGKF